MVKEPKEGDAVNSEILDYAFDNKFGINHSNPLGLGPPQIGINSQTVNKSKHSGYGYVGLATNSKIRGIMVSYIKTGRVRYL